MFIPEMLKYSTGRGKPGWGKESTKPKWWPLDVPWANVRHDVRSDEQKLKVRLQYCIQVLLYIYLVNRYAFIFLPLQNIYILL